MLPLCFRLSRDQLHQAEQQQHEGKRAQQARRDHVLRLELLRVLLVIGALAHAEEAPEHRPECVQHAAHDFLPGASKNVYESDIVVRLYQRYRVVSFHALKKDDLTEAKAKQILGEVAEKLGARR